MEKTYKVKARDQIESQTAVISDYDQDIIDKIMRVSDDSYDRSKARGIKDIHVYEGVSRFLKDEEIDPSDIHSFSEIESRDRKTKRKSFPITNLSFKIKNKNKVEKISMVCVPSCERCGDIQGLMFNEKILCTTCYLDNCILGKTS